MKKILTAALTLVVLTLVSCSSVPDVSKILAKQPTDITANEAVKLAAYIESALDNVLKTDDMAGVTEVSKNYPELGKVMFTFSFLTPAQLKDVDENALNAKFEEVSRHVMNLQRQNDEPTNIVPGDKL